MALRFTLRQLEYFVAVGEAGSIVQAPERVSVSPSSISVMRFMVTNDYGYALANVRPRSMVSPDGNPVSQMRLEGNFRLMIMGLASTSSERKTRTVEAFVAHCRASVGASRVPGLAVDEQNA